MSHHQQSASVFEAQLFEGLENQSGGLRVEVSGRLVGEKDLGAIGQRPRHRHPLPLASTQAAGRMVAALTETDRLQQLDRSQCSQSSGHPRQRHRELDVLLGAEHLEEPGVLKDEANRVAAEPGQLPAAQSRDVASGHDDIARPRALEPTKDRQQGALARARFTDQGQVPPRRDLQVQIAEDRDLILSVAVALPNAAEVDGDRRLHDQTPMMHLAGRRGAARMRLARRGTAAMAAILLVSCCDVGGHQSGRRVGPAPTPPSVAVAPQTVATGLPAIDGIPCRVEAGNLHFHAHLQLLQDGRAIVLPRAIGRPRGDCVYLAHTHSLDGVIHVQAQLDTPNPTLGQFFAVWGRPLSRYAAAGLESPGGLHVYVDGREFAGDPRDIELLPHRTIVIEAGAPVRPVPYEFAPGL